MEVVRFLDRTSTRYELSKHRPTFTAQQMAAEEHVPGMEVAKPVVVKADEECYMCVLPACCKIDLDALKRQIGAINIRLIDESEMARLFPDCDLGAEPPIGIMYGMLTLMDMTLEKDEYIVFQAGAHDKAVKMEMDEFKRLTSPRILNFSYKAS